MAFVARTWWNPFRDRNDWFTIPSSKETVNPSLPSLSVSTRMRVPTPQGIGLIAALIEPTGDGVLQRWRISASLEANIQQEGPHPHTIDEDEDLASGCSDFAAGTLPEIESSPMYCGNRHLP